MERKLASVQRVLEILPIPNADAIELVKINGWQCVTKKSEFQVGDLGVFFEIDAIPPDTEPFQFLWRPKTHAPGMTCARPEKFRIRTMKLRGALSQGLFMPLDALGVQGIAEGTNVTEQLGVEKYEAPPPEGMGEFRAQFPAFIPKTDELRVQSVPDVLGELHGNPYVVTLKYDGTSATFCIDPRDGTFHACGRNFSIREGDNLYWRMAHKYGLPESLKRFPHLAIQGEIVGPGIQKNRLGLKELTLYAFSIFDFRACRFLDHAAANQVLSELQIPAVAVVEIGESFCHTQESLVSLAEGYYPGTKNEREGIVIRPQKETRSEVLAGRLSFKAISNRYLLKDGE
jgi:RNA ligase (TIGR02306 family)